MDSSSTPAFLVGVLHWTTVGNGSYKSVHLADRILQECRLDLASYTYRRGKRSNPPPSDRLSAKVSSSPSSRRPSAVAATLRSLLLVSPPRTSRDRLLFCAGSSTAVSQKKERRPWGQDCSIHRPTSRYRWGVTQLHPVDIRNSKMGGVAGVMKVFKRGKARQ